MGRLPKYTFTTWQEAEEARRLRRAGASWSLVAERMGWRTLNPRQAVMGAMRRAPRPPDRGGGSLRRAAAVRLAEADPVLSRRCAKCGRPNYTLRTLSGDYFETVAVGFVSLGGRWLCPDCAPRRPRPEERVCEAFAVPCRVGRIH